MTSADIQSFKPAFTEKQPKFEWGVAQPSQRTNNQLLNKAQPSKTQNEQQNTHTRSKSKLNPYGINFSDLPVKQSEIMSPYHKQTITQYASAQQVQYNQQQSAINNENQETIDRLNQLKTQFQILKNMMIDSHILEKNKNDDRVSNHSRSVTNQPVKIGQAIRGKDRKSKMGSSSISSNKDLYIKKNRLAQVSNQNSKISRNHQHAQIRHSKDLSSNRSDDSKIRTGRSHNPSRVAQYRGGNVATGLNSFNALQKHALELQLRNTVQKTQLLIQNEILLKTRNHELEQTLKVFMNEAKNPETNTNSKKIHELNQKIVQYENRISDYKFENQELIHRIGKLEAESFAYEAKLDLLKRQKHQQSSSAMQMKLKFASLQIDNKRLKMEKDIDLRNLQYDLERLTRQNQSLRNRQFDIKHQYITISAPPPVSSQPRYDQSTDNSYRIKIKQLQDELDDRQKRHKLIVEQLNAKINFKQETQLLQLVENIHKQKSQQEKGQLHQELQRLKDQLSRIKKQPNLTQSQFGIQSKVISLQHALRRDQEDKHRHLLELQQFRKQFEHQKQANKTLQKQKQTYAEKYESVVRQVHELKLQLNQAQIFKSKFEQSTKTIDHLNGKIQELDSLLRNYEDLQEQMYSVRETLKKKEAAHNLQMKDARRRVDQAEFQAFKSQQQNKITVDLNKRKLQSDIQILKRQTDAVKNDCNYYKDQFNNLRSQNQILVTKLKDFELNRDNRIKFQTQSQIHQKQRVQRQHQQQLSAISQRFMQEEQRLIDQIASLTRRNQELSGMMKRYVILESQNLQLRALCRDRIGASSAITHLWDIKQIQYGNINAILKAVHTKNNQQKTLEKNSKIDNLNPTNNQPLTKSKLNEMQPPQAPQPYFHIDTPLSLRHSIGQTQQYNFVEDQNHDKMLPPELPRDSMLTN